MKHVLLKVLCIVSIWIVVICGPSVLGQQELLARGSQLELQGRFKEAAAQFSAALEDKSVPTVDRKLLQFELDRLDRIKKDFPYTKTTLFTELTKSVKDLARSEYEHWVNEGRFDSREIDGQRWFMTSSVGNLFWRYPELSSRRIPQKDTSAIEKRHWESCVEIQKAALAEHKPYVLPKRFRVAMAVTAAANATPEDETIRAWLPIPREYLFHGDFRVISSSVPVRHTAPPDSPIRSVMLEQTARKNRPSQFALEYEYTTHGVWFDVKPSEVQPLTQPNTTLAAFTREAPHIAFTPEMRALSREIAGAETNPYLKAKRFYDWIADHIKYSYAIEYSTIRNISEYCRTKGYGDCGQEALLFITLCRLNGIPARWQSGWSTFPGAKSIHDWSEIFIAPYGWMPVDPYMGIYATRYANSLTPDQKRELRDFYFGGLDQYRMIANSDHNQELNPPKQSLRSDTVDFQRGELEWGNHNIYFDKYSYDLTVKEIKPAGTIIE
jgi:transglutaminase-like putative cysteine protease